MQYSITKSYTETMQVGGGYKKFSTTLSKTIDPKSGEELEKEAAKLFEQARLLTERDIRRELGEQK
jgi:hypothetical protein